MWNTVEKHLKKLLSGLFSEMLPYIKNKFWGKIQRNLFMGRLLKRVRQFINEHDGTILTTGDFERYLIYHGPIDRIIDAVIGNNPSGTKDACTFVNPR